MRTRWLQMADAFCVVVATNLLARLISASFISNIYTEQEIHYIPYCVFAPCVWSWLRTCWPDLSLPVLYRIYTQNKKYTIIPYWVFAPCGWNAHSQPTNNHHHRNITLPLDQHNSVNRPASWVTTLQPFNTVVNLIRLDDLRCFITVPSVGDRTRDQLFDPCNVMYR
jgi:hypothetical protein